MLDQAAACTEVVEAALRLVRRHPQLDAIVLECTNMPPYADAVAQATGLPVHHLMTLVHERWARLPRDNAGSPVSSPTFT